MTPLLTLEDGSTEGGISADGQVAGSYLHGIFDEPIACTELLAWAGLDSPAAVDRTAIREQQLDRLADTLEQYLNLQYLFPQWCPA